MQSCWHGLGAAAPAPLSRLAAAPTPLSRPAVAPQPRPAAAPAARPPSQPRWHRLLLPGFVCGCVCRQYCDCQRRDIKTFTQNTSACLSPPLARPPPSPAVFFFVCVCVYVPSVAMEVFTQERVKRSERSCLR